jgi:topoisomerase-4 subunit B
MGKNTPERQDFIIDNLRVEKDLAEETISDEKEAGELDIAS